MPHELLDITIDEVSGVDKAANKRTFLIIKRADDAKLGGPAPADTPEPESVEKQYPENEMPPLTTGEIVAQAEAMEQLCRVKGAMQESLYRIFECAPLEEQPRLLMQSVQEFSAYARQAISQMGALRKAEALLEELDEELEAFTKAGRKISASRMRRLKTIMAELEAIMLEGIDDVEKRDSSECPDHTGDVPMNKPEPDQIAQLTKRAETAEADAEALNKKWVEEQDRVKDLLKKLDEHLAEITKLQAKVDENDPEAIWKGVSPQLRARIEKAEAERDEERNARLRLDYIAKAMTFKALPMSPDDDWEVFKDMAALPPKSQRRIEAWLKAGTEAMKYSGLFKEIGRAGTGEYQGDALEQIEKLTQEKLEKGLAKTHAQAMDAVLSEHPTLYNQYKAERRGGAR